MRTTRVWRLGASTAYGEIQLDGDEITGTDQLTQEMVAGRLGDGLSPREAFDYYVDWSNGYVAAREVAR